MIDSKSFSDYVSSRITRWSVMAMLPECRFLRHSYRTKTVKAITTALSTNGECLICCDLIMSEAKTLKVWRWILSSIRKCKKPVYVISDDVIISRGQIVENLLRNKILLVLHI